MNIAGIDTLTYMAFEPLFVNVDTLIPSDSDDDETTEYITRGNEWNEETARLLGIAESLNVGLGSWWESYDGMRHLLVAFKAMRDRIGATVNSYIYMMNNDIVLREESKGHYHEASGLLEEVEAMVLLIEREYLRTY